MKIAIAIAPLVCDFGETGEVSGMPPSNKTKFDRGEGNDSLLGGEDNDTVLGQSGHDKLYGNEGNDLLEGGDNPDTLEGGADKDTLKGGNHDDYLSGGDGNDKLFGQSSHDRLFGDANHDYLHGGDGNDSLNGGTGNDTLVGGKGNDRLDGNENFDAVDYSVDNDKAVSVDLDAGTATGDSIGTDILLNIERVIGSTKADTLNGSANGDVFGGKNGNDLISGNSGNDKLWGSDGHDYLDGGADNDYLNGGAQNDVLVGGDGNDTIDGGDDDDVLIEKMGSDDRDVITLTDTSLSGFGEDVIRNIETVRLQGNSGNNRFTDTGFTGLSVVDYDGDVDDYTISNNNGTWKVEGDGTDRITGFDQIAFAHDGEDRVSSIFSTAHGATFVSATARVSETNENGTYDITGGNYGPTTYLLEMEGSTGLNLNFDTNKMVDFLGDINQTSSALEKQRLGAKLGFALAKKAPYVGGLATPAEAFTNYFYFDKQEAKYQAQQIKKALNNSDYAPDTWIDSAEVNREVINITDFQIGVDTIVLPSVDGSSITYQVAHETGGAAVYIKADNADAQQFLSIANNYQTHGISDTDFADIISDLISVSEDSDQVASISTFKQTVTTTNDINTNPVGSYAGDRLRGANYLGNSTDPLVGSYSLVGLYGDDLLEGANKNDFLYGGFEVTPQNFHNSNDPMHSQYENDGNDVLLGKEGDDVLDGGSGSLSINTGDDVLYGGAGDDTLFGRDGADTFVFDSTDGIDIIKDFNGAEGDTIVIDTNVFGANSSVSFNSTTNELSVNGNVIAELENQSGFDLATDVSLKALEVSGLAPF